MKKTEIVSRVFKYVDRPFSFLYNHIRGNDYTIQLKCGAKIPYESGYGAIYTLMQVLDKGYLISNSGNSLLIETDDELKFIQPNVGCLNEDFRSMYLDHFDVRGKCVFDIGGFFGESALYFSKIGGASRVIVYEPLVKNCEIIENNIRLNKAENIQTITVGVSSEKGTITIASEYPPGTSAFGSQGGGTKYSLEINVISWNELLQHAIENDAFLIKSDCEGSEKFLLEADRKLITAIPNYIFEIHAHEDELKITKMFSELAYKMEKVIKVNDQISINKYFRATSP